MISKKNKTYITLYWITLTEFNLTLAECCLIYLIKGLSKNLGYCYASKKSLAETLNTTETTIYSLTKKLIGYGLLKKCGFLKYGAMCLAPTSKFNEHIKSLKDVDFKE